jgi:hypothetical protein
VALSSNPSGKQADIGFAAILIGASIWTYAEAGNYPGSSGIYPQVLSLLLAVLAALVIVRRLATPAGENEPRLFLNPGRFVLSAAILTVYVMLVGLVGYLLPSLALGVVVPFLLGYRKPLVSLAVTAGTLAFIVLVFFVVLGRPLPPDLLDPLLEMLR